MKKNDIANLSDPQLVEYFRDAALRRAKCGFNVTWANKIFDHEMVPAYEALAARGPASLRGLLALTHDSSLNVREDAAILAYDLDPSLCRSVLKQLMDEPGWVGIAALAGLLHKDPEFAAEFERNANINYDKYKQEQARRFSGDPTEN